MTSLDAGACVLCLHHISQPVACTPLFGRISMQHTGVTYQEQAVVCLSSCNVMTPMQC